MRNLKKEYKKPSALVTGFECADVITTSGTLSETPSNHVGDKTYIKAGSKSWRSGFGENQSHQISGGTVTDPNGPVTRPAAGADRWRRAACPHAARKAPLGG